MRNITYLIKEGNMNYYEVMDLPYVAFLSLLKNFRLIELESDPEYRKQLEQQKYLEVKEPQISRLKSRGLLNKK